MYMNTKLAAIFLTLTLAACGGGGSSSGGSTNPGGTNNTGGGGENTGGGGSNTGGDSNADYSAIVGLYDTSTLDNEQYYYIDEDGVFTAYNYLGDAADGGDNCYRESTGDEANASISGQTLTALDNGNFTINANGTTATFEMAGDTVDRVSTPIYSAGGTLSATFNGEPIRLTTKEELDISIDDIENMMCE